MYRTNDESVKEEIRVYAKAHGLKVADKPGSQDFYEGITMNFFK
jgi:hypothetical protein